MAVRLVMRKPTATNRKHNHQLSFWALQMFCKHTYSPICSANNVIFVGHPLDMAIRVDGHVRATHTHTHTQHNKKMENENERKTHASKGFAHK